MLLFDMLAAKILKIFYLFILCNRGAQRMTFWAARWGKFKHNKIIVVWVSRHFSANRSPTKSNRNLSLFSGSKWSGGGRRIGIEGQGMWRKKRRGGSENETKRRLMGGEGTKRKTRQVRTGGFGRTFSDNI